MLYQLGKLTFDCPGPLGVQEVTEEFGYDFAVKPIVGAMMRREPMGPSDHKFTLTGELLPYFHTRIGIGSGLGEVATLQAMAAGGKPHLLTRGDGVNMNFWLIERGGLRSARLSSQGIGHVIQYEISLVESPDAPSPEDMLDDLNSLLAPFAQAVGQVANAVTQLFQ